LFVGKDSCRHRQTKAAAPAGGPKQLRASFLDLRNLSVVACRSSRNGGDASERPGAVRGGSLGSKSSFWWWLSRAKSPC